jgi:hypothetical protein
VHLLVLNELSNSILDVCTHITTYKKQWQIYEFYPGICERRIIKGAHTFIYSSQSLFLTLCMQTECTDFVLLYRCLAEDDDLLLTFVGQFMCMDDL